MKKTILAVGIACATLMAVAQSNARQDSSAQAPGVVSPRDVATGQASGKRMHKPMMVNQSTDLHNQKPVHRDIAARETGSGMATGKTMAADDWNSQQKTQSTSGDNAGAQAGVMVRESPSKASLGKTSVTADEQAKTKSNMAGAQSNPMYKDSGTSGVNPLYENNARNATKTRSNIQNNRVATGDVDGDGTADHAVVKSKSNITNNRVAAGDVNGDGKSDVVVSPNPAPAQMKGDFSRGHQPDRQAVNDGKTDRRPVRAATDKNQHN